MSEAANPEGRHHESVDSSEVDVPLSRLDGLASVPVADHVGVFETVQRELDRVLADLDES
ncbi:MAG: hypothetical protein ACRDN9_17560 [Streptosporangiaceae bacterium]